MGAKLLFVCVTVLMGCQRDPGGLVLANLACTPGETQECDQICPGGVQTCGANGAWDTCVPPEEVCDGVDNDCDGQTDEGCACRPDETSPCLTRCGTVGQRVCQEDSYWWSACQAPEEECNSKDDDCDGETDEDFECVRPGWRSCTTEKGCPGGQQYCDQACAWTECLVSEECNGEDDDCDDVADDGNPGGGNSCGNETGECEPGVEICVGGGLRCCCESTGQCERGVESLLEGKLYCCPDGVVTCCAGTCGDGSCDGTEEPCTCPADCPGDCCGDAICGDTESVCNCVADCMERCGDGCCTGNEDKCGCALDCTADVCGDGCCTGSEDGDGCPWDCPLFCNNDGTCDAGETACGCPLDGCPAAPGDGCCTAGEDACSNPTECGPSCGDTCCSPPEDCANCASDCGCAPPDVCLGGTCVPPCGDGTCDAGLGEDCASCVADCACTAPEVCDGGICTACPARTCVPGQTEACRTECGPGERTCSDNCVWSVCEPHPLPAPVVTKLADPGDAIWVSVLEGPAGGPDVAYDLAVDTFGNVYVTGSTTGVGTGEDITTVSYDERGDLRWQHVCDGPASGKDVGRAVALDGDGHVYVTGESDGGTDADILTIQYSNRYPGPDAAPNWEKRYDGRVDRPYGMALDSSGNVYVTGNSGDSDDWDPSTDRVTLKYSPEGDLEWKSLYDGPDSAQDEGRGVAVDDASGNVYVTGFCQAADGSFSYCTTRHRGRDGEVNGESFVRGRYALAIALDATGVYVTGRGSGGYLTIKYDGNLNEIWDRTYAGPCDGGLATAMAIDSAGRVTVTGSSEAGRKCSGVPDLATVQYDASGRELWAWRYDGSNRWYDAANAIAVDSSDNVVVTGQAAERHPGDLGDYDYLTIKHTTGSQPNGQPKWVRTYDGTSDDDRAWAVGVDPAGYVYVTGGSQRDPLTHANMSWVTIKYER